MGKLIEFVFIIAAIIVAWPILMLAAISED
jgi:hypothetical protein